MTRPEPVHLPVTQRRDVIRAAGGSVLATASWIPDGPVKAVVLLASTRHHFAKP